MTQPFYRSESTKLLDDSVSLPPHDAIQNLFNSDDDIVRITSASSNRRILDKDGLQNGDTSSTLLNLHQAELMKYRETVRQQTDEILSLRRRLRDLENVNSDLKRDLNGFSELTRINTEAEEEIEALDKKQLAAKYNSLVSRLARQTAEVKDYRDKVLLLQQELIRKNREAKELLSQTGKNKEGVEQLGGRREIELEERLAARTKKVRVLEELVRNQEKTMDRMEKLLAAKAHKKGSQNKQPRLDSDNLRQENEKLRKSLQELSNVSRAMDRVNYQDEPLELLMMHEKLEKAKGRIRSLEIQLQEDAKNWSLERTDLTMRLMESERGFQRPQSNPQFNPWGSYDTLRRGQDPWSYADSPGRGRDKPKGSPRRYTPDYAERDERLPDIHRKNIND